MRTVRVAKTVVVETGPTTALPLLIPVEIGATEAPPVPVELVETVVELLVPLVNCAEQAAANARMAVENLMLNVSSVVETTVLLRRDRSCRTEELIAGENPGHRYAIAWFWA